MKYTQAIFHHIKILHCIREMLICYKPQKLDGKNSTFSLIRLKHIEYQKGHQDTGKILPSIWTSVLRCTWFILYGGWILREAEGTLWF